MRLIDFILLSLIPLTVSVVNAGYSLDKPLDVSAMDDELDTIGWIPHVLPKEPFPQWLTDITGLTEWPGLDPPYIPLDFINFNQIPDIEPYARFTCPKDNSTCAVDCFNCFVPEDIITCSKLSQTFDDGPSPETTTLLDSIDYKTTFFTIGINVVKYPDVYRDMQKRGHLLLSHTWSHAYLPGLSNEKIMAQLEWSMWAMNATGGHIPKYWRPPYAGLDNRVRAIARQFHLRTVLGEHDSSDWMLIFLPNEITEEQIYDRLRSWILNTTTTVSGIVMEHESSKETIKVGIEIGKIIGSDQLTINQCVGDVDYYRVY